MYLQTNRLTLIALKHHQLVNYLRLDYSLEKELKLAFIKRTIAPPLAFAFKNRILPHVNNPSNNYLFFTLWAVTYKNLMVGELCFKGEPNNQGEIEIGYGTYAVFQNNGYMAEAVEVMIKWAFKQSNVQVIIAKTNPDNFPSHKILIKNNFIKTNEADMIEWKLYKTN